MKFLLVVLFSLSAAADIRVGSKIFTESYILSEIISQIVDSADETQAQRKFGLGGTGIVFQALLKGDIDIYPEYTGTITEAILKNKETDLKAIRVAMEKMGLGVSNSLGFENTYAIGVRREIAKKYSLKKLSDLQKAPSLVAGLSHEFLKRSDGWPGLAQRYNLNLKTNAIAHGLAYEALEKREIDLTDLYSTDAKIEKLDLVVLEDDKEYFPKYEAVLLYRKSLEIDFPKTFKNLKKLEGRFREKQMRQLNYKVDLEKQTFAQAAEGFLKTSSNSPQTNSLKRYTREHIFLVSLALLFSMIIGIPLGVLAFRFQVLGQLILLFSGIVQTIPSLALLCFLIPVFGIGTKPALAALFLYGLLPIVVNTHGGLLGIDSKLIESAKALGLSQLQRLFLIELPLASQSLMNGIKTSAITSIGTATLAALVGAGGFGVPIVTGLALNDIPMILSGGVPAALMAIGAHFLFEGLNRIIIPRGLR